MQIDSTEVAIGDPLPEWQITPTLADAVMYCGAMWEFQKIHYDDAWARRENLDGAILQGPVLGNYLARTVTAWVGPRGRLQSLSWRNHGMAPLGETLRCTGKVTGKRLAADAAVLGCELAILNPRGQTIVSATAAVQWPARGMA